MNHLKTYASQLRKAEPMIYFPLLGSKCGRYIFSIPARCENSPVSRSVHLRAEGAGISAILYTNL